jgi:acetyl-CoA carboxylase alpha subunit
MYFNTQQILKNTAEVLQIPTSNLRTQEEVEQMVEEQKRQQQEQAQLQQAQVAGQLNESMAKAESLRSEAA